MITLGITGGIGSGKSYVTRIFGALGIPYYDSDNRTKQMYRENPDLKEALTRLLGPDIYVSKTGYTEKWPRSFSVTSNCSKKSISLSTRLW